MKRLNKWFRNIILNDVDEEHDKLTTRKKFLEKPSERTYKERRPNEEKWL